MVIDVDSYKGDSLDDIEVVLGKLPSTAEVITGGGGRHRYFKHPGGRIKSTTEPLGRGVDIRADGGYVVAPPSNHISGRPYTFEMSSDPFDGMQLAELPAMWRNRLSAKQMQPSTNGQALNQSNLQAALQSLEKLSPNRADSYDGWLEVGMALHTCDQSEVMLDAWDRWSQQSEKHQPGICRDKWQTFNSNGNGTKPLGLGSLINWAREDSGESDWKPSVSDGAEMKSGDDVVVLTNMSTIEALPVNWLWRDRIPSGMLTVISGDPGSGKSTLLLDIASRASAGVSWPDQPDNLNPAGSVMLLLSEDSLEHTVNPRLTKAGADLKRIQVFEGFRAKDGFISPIELDQHLRHLDRVLSDNPEVRLLGIDTLDAFLGETDSHRKSEVQRVLSGLSAIAQKHDVAVVGILHLRKNSADKALYKTLGSLGFVSAPRMVWAVSRDHEDQIRRLMTCVKCNIAPEPTGLAFTIEDDGGGIGVIQWQDGEVTQSADEALNPSMGNKKSKLDAACDWLIEALANGKLNSAVLQNKAKEDGISFGTLRRAKDQLGIKPRKINDCWYCELPQDAHVP